MESKNDHEHEEPIQNEESNQIPEDSESQEESMMHHNNENLQCRFYKKDFPDENDIVIVSELCRCSVPLNPVYVSH